MIIDTYTCLECGVEFDEPRDYEERHGLDSPPYEKWAGCPACGSAAFVQSHVCDHCGELITNTIIKTADGNEYCENCVDILEL